MEANDVDKKVEEALNLSLKHGSQKLLESLAKTDRCPICTLKPPWKHTDKFAEYQNGSKYENDNTISKENQSKQKDEEDDDSVSVKLEDISNNHPDTEQRKSYIFNCLS